MFFNIVTCRVCIDVRHGQDQNICIRAYFCVRNMLGIVDQAGIGLHVLQPCPSNASMALECRSRLAHGRASQPG